MIRTRRNARRHLCPLTLPDPDQRGFCEASLCMAWRETVTPNRTRITAADDFERAEWNRPLVEAFPDEYRKARDMAAHAENDPDLHPEDEWRKAWQPHFADLVLEAMTKDPGRPMPEWPQRPGRVPPTWEFVTVADIDEGLHPYWQEDEESAGERALGFCGLAGDPRARTAGHE